MKKSLMLLLFVVPLCGFGQEIVTRDYRYFEIICNKIDSVVRSVLYPKIDSIDCNIIQDNDTFYADSLSIIYVKVNLDSTGKFHVEYVRIASNCVEKKQYLEDKREAIIFQIEAMEPIFIFYHEIRKKIVTKEEIFRITPYLEYWIPVFIKH